MTSQLVSAKNNSRREYNHSSIDLLKMKYRYSNEYLLSNRAIKIHFERRVHFLIYCRSILNDFLSTFLFCFSYRYIYLTRLTIECDWQKKKRDRERA